MLSFSAVSILIYSIVLVVYIVYIRKVASDEYSRPFSVC